MNDTAQQHAIEIENVTYAYKDHLAIENISFNVNNGEVFGLVGLNGAGKTTLMKSILGLLQKYQGHISIYGENALDKNSRKNLTFLPEKFEPSWFLTGREFIVFSSRFYGRDVQDDVITKAAEALQLRSDFLDKRVQSYSKGMRQKLGLMAAFLSPCPLIMLDEPMSGLDPRARIFVKDEILKARAAGRTVFFSSHILADIDELCDHIGIIHDKRLCFWDKPTALKEHHNESNLERAFLSLISVSKDTATEAA